MDIQNLTIREAFTPEAWQLLRQHFLKEKLEGELRELQKTETPPASLNPVAVKTPPKRKPSGGGLRKLEYPPPLDISKLAFTPGQLSAMQIQGMKRTHPDISIRRDLIGKVLRMAGSTGANVEDIRQQLGKFKFPIDDEYYGELIDGRVRILTAINNDLTFFLKRAAKVPWVQRLANGNWRWIR